MGVTENKTWGSGRETWESGRNKSIYWKTGSVKSYLSQDRVVSSEGEDLRLLFNNPTGLPS